MQYSETEVHTHNESLPHSDPSKLIMDNPILIVAICMGKSIFPESRENYLQKTATLQDLSPLQDSYYIFILDLVLP